MKTYRVSFYQVNCAQGFPAAFANDLLAPWVDVAAPPIVELGGDRYNLIAIRIAPGRYKCELKRYGHDDLPHAGTLEGDERELELDDDEMTIERNYFLYFQQQRLVVWQENRRASTSTTLGRYFTRLVGPAVVLDPLLTQEATRAMLLGQHQPKAIEFTVARPLNPNMYDPNDDSGRVMQLLAGLGGMTGSFRISANAMGIRGRLLEAGRVLGLGNALAESGRARKVRIHLDGVDHPIDLITDRLQAKMDVEMGGRYPLPNSIFAALQGAKDDMAAELGAILG